MANNKSTFTPTPEDLIIIERAQRRVLRLYRRLRKSGGWRAVVETLKLRYGPLCECKYPGQLSDDFICSNCHRYLIRPRLNIATVYNFAIHKTVPPRKYRKPVFLPKRLPSEHRPYEKRDPSQVMISRICKALDTLGFDYSPPGEKTYLLLASKCYYCNRPDPDFVFLIPPARAFHIACLIEHNKNRSRSK